LRPSVCPVGVMSWITQLPGPAAGHSSASLLDFLGPLPLPSSSSCASSSSSSSTSSCASFSCLIRASSAPSSRCLRFAAVSAILSFLPLSAPCQMAPCSVRAVTRKAAPPAGVGSHAAWGHLTEQWHQRRATRRCRSSCNFPGQGSREVVHREDCLPVPHTAPRHRRALRHPFVRLPSRRRQQRGRRRPCFRTCPALNSFPLKFEREARIPLLCQSSRGAVLVGRARAPEPRALARTGRATASWLPSSDL